MIEFCENMIEHLNELCNTDILYIYGILINYGSQHSMKLCAFTNKYFIYNTMYSKNTIQYQNISIKYENKFESILH